LETLGLDNVFAGDGTKVGERRKEIGYLQVGTKNDISICALGGSVATLNGY
jgi:hypothetical protein